MRKKRAASCPDITTLLLDDKNANKGTKKGGQAIKASLKKYGAGRSILIDKNNKVIAGNKTLQNARDLGFKQLRIIETDGKEIIAVKRKDLNLDDKASYARKLAIMDNRAGELSLEWDEEILREIGLDKKEWEDLFFTERDMRKLGISVESDGDDTIAMDLAEEVNKEWKIKSGDIWGMGEHKIICADCCQNAVLKYLFQDNRAVLMNTDPPYGINYGDLVKSREFNQGQKNKSKHEKIQGDELTGEKLQAFLEASIKTALPFLIDNPAFYLWHPMLTQGTFFAAAAAAADIVIHRQIIWCKPSLILGRGDYHWRHELCFYGWIKGRRCAWYGGRDQNTVWEIGRENDNFHPTQKPVDLFIRPIENHTKKGEIVYEPFSGSGSQIIAAEITERKCYAVEIHPPYVAVALQRWKDKTGKNPKKITGTV